MCKWTLKSVVLLVLLIVPGCTSIDLDVPLSDDSSSTIDDRLIGVWEVAQASPNESRSSFFVGKKEGTANTLEAVVVNLEKDRSAGVQRLDLFGRKGKHDYLTIGPSSPDKQTSARRWLIARYEVTSESTIKLHFLKYDALRTAVNRALQNDNGSIVVSKPVLRDETDWVFPLPGHEERQYTLTDSPEMLIKFFDENGDSLFDQRAIVLQKASISHQAAAVAGTKAETVVLPSMLVPKAPAPASRPLSRQDGHKKQARTLPQSFEVVVTLAQPDDAIDKLEAFRSVALRMPWAYVLDRTGALCIFRIETESLATELRPAKIVENVGDGDDCQLFGDVLVCTRGSQLETYSLEKPDEPKHLGTFGLKTTVEDDDSEFESGRIVRNGSIAFVLNGTAISSYDVNSPGAPKLLGDVQAKQIVHTGCAAGNFLYASQDAGNQPGIAVFDVSNSAKPTEVGFVRTSRSPYGLFLTPNHRLVVSMESGQSWHSVSDDSISVNGTSALFDLTDPKQPTLIREFQKSGGTTAALLNVNNDCYLACNGVVFAVKNDALEPNSVFYPIGSAMDDFPYHGDADGMHVALPADDVAFILRLKK